MTTLGNWKSTCWSSDDDGDYLEMQLVCSDKVRIDRQFLLSRRGHFALFADAVVTSGAEESSIASVCRWPPVRR